MHLAAKALLDETLVRYTVNSPPVNLLIGGNVWKNNGPASTVSAPSVWFYRPFKLRDSLRAAGGQADGGILLGRVTSSDTFTPAQRGLPTPRAIRVVIKRQGLQNLTVVSC